MTFQEEMIVIALLLSRLPFYLYVLVKMWQFRNSLILIESRLLGITATCAVAGAFVNTFGDSKLLANLIGWLFSFFLFYTAYKAKALVKENKPDNASKVHK